MPSLVEGSSNATFNQFFNSDSVFNDDFADLDMRPPALKMDLTAARNSFNPKPFAPAESKEDRSVRREDEKNEQESGRQYIRPVRFLVCRKDGGFANIVAAGDETCRMKMIDQVLHDNDRVARRYLRTARLLSSAP